MRHIFSTLFLMALLFAGASENRLVILHTNDTHSQIDPDDKDGRGGVARRKVVIDSVRACEDNVLLIDAGDIVQGTLYFNLFGGEVENRLMDMLGYDFRILGNHEFDNGVDSLAKMIADAKSEFLATNYVLDGSALDGRFSKYAVRKVGDRKIGFIGINLKPQGMISEGNYDGVGYLDAVEAANAAAWWLKNVDGCDMVVAITHIGYNPSMPPGDLTLAQASKDIDVIIGGHSHDYIDPAQEKYRWTVPNAEGRDVLVTQVGKAGKAVGRIEIDLDSLKAGYSLISVDSRLDSRLDPKVTDLIAGYRAGVDSLMAHPVGRTAVELVQGEAPLTNFATDIVLERGRQLADSVEFSLLNKGGIRRGLPKGTITEGQIITMLPFNNRVRVIDIAGKDLLPAFEQMARVGGNGVSEQVRASYYVDDKGNAVLKEVTVNGSPLEPERVYRVATIDYMANGGDYMPTLARGKQVVESPTVLYNDVLAHVRGLKNKKINPPTTVRFSRVSE